MYLEKLKKIRIEKKLTTQDMADYLMISKPFYSQIETGKRRLSYDMAVKIGKVFKMKPDQLFYEEYIKNEISLSSEKK